MVKYDPFRMHFPRLLLLALLWGVLNPIQAQNPNITVNPTSFDYEGVTTGNNKDRAFAVENSGDAQLVIFGAELVGANADQFRITGGGGGTILDPGEVRLITVRFSPTSLGAKEAELKVDSDDPDQASLLVPLSGAGLGVPDLVLEDDLIDFFTVRVETTKSFEIGLENNGTADLELRGSTLIGEGKDAFNIITDLTSIVLAPLQDTTITINFTPDILGEVNALLTIDSNDLRGAPHEIVLKGTGVTSSLVADTLNIEFDEVTVRDSSFSEIIVTNEGSQAISVTSFQIEGAGAAWFSISDGVPPFTLEGGASQTVEIAFSPQGEGQQQATLTLTASDLDEPPLSFSLLGVGINPVISISPEEFSFGPILGGFDSTRVAVISNAGPGRLFVDSLRIRGADARMFEYVSDEPPFVVEPGEDFSLAVAYIPIQSGLHEAELQMFFNSTVEPRKDIPISGEGKIIQVDLANAPVSQNVDLTFTLPEGFDPVTKELFYRIAGEEAFRVLELSGNPPDFVASLPGDIMTPRGLEYYVRVAIGGGAATLPPSNPRANPMFLPATMERIENPFEMLPRTYQMISLPLQLNDYSPDAVFIDDFGPYNIRSWRLLRWGGEQYIEYPQLQDSLTSGKGFWLITSGDTQFDLDEAWSTDATTPFELVLEPGWNQIGNPYAFPIEWTTRNLDPRVELPIGFDGTDFVFEQEVLEPWQGYFINNLSPDTIRVTLNNEIAPGRKTEARKTRESIYELHLHATLQDAPHIKDHNTVVGFAEDATELHDRMDYTKPPPIGDFVQFRIVQEGNSYAGNFKPPTEKGQSWELEAISSIDQATVNLNLIAEGVLTEGHTLYILDLDKNNAVSIIDNALQLNLGDANSIRRFKVILGNEAFALEESDNVPIYPVEFKLDLNYPNPFSQQTTIGYHLDEDSNVLLEIYNVIGEKIVTLVNDVQSPGKYQTVWSGRNDAGQYVANGIYFTRLTSKSGTLTQKMILLR